MSQGRPVLLEPPVHRWECGGCNQTAVTREARPHTPFHTCRNGLSTPFTPEGERRKVTVNEREDYVGREIVQLDADGRPAMNVVTEYGDGRRDCAVYAPCATGAGGAR